MKKLSLLMALVMLVCTVLCACGTEADKLTGTWTASVEGQQVSLTLNEDGSGKISALGGLLSLDFDYTAENGKLYLDSEEDYFSSNTLDYVLKGDTLTLTNEDETIEFTRE